MDQPLHDNELAPLDDAQRRLEAVLNNASVSIFLMDDRQRCVYMNRAAEHLTGFSFEEVLSLDRPLHDIIHHTHPDGTPFPLEECAIDRAFPEHNQVQGEEVFVRKDGSFYPVAFTASPIRDETSNTIGTIIEVRDITGEKLAEEQQRLLMNELNHRVKNTLATVHSIAWQTFKNSDPDAVDRFTGRLGALSAAHNILTGSAWEGADLAKVVEAAVAPFGLERFTVEGPHCEVHPKAAVTLSMVLHELATNAAKYGSLSADRGSVIVKWRFDERENGSDLQLSWQEEGGPAVTPPSHTGFGTRLIERQLALEFDGRATMDFREEGLLCQMRLRIPSSPEPLTLTPRLQSIP